MIKKLKIKIISFIMLVTSILSIVISVGISIYSVNNNERSVYMSLDNEINLSMNTSINDHSYRYENLIFELNKDNSFLIKNNTLNIEYEDIMNIIKEIDAYKGQEGRIDNLLFKSKNDIGKHVICLIKASNLDKLNNKVYVYAFSLTLSFLLIIFFLSLFISKISTKPIEQSIKNERTFIQNASHELKTPLAVISSNNEILEKKYPGEEWLKSNKYEIQNMKKLISDMLNLEKLDSNDDFEINEINLSKVVNKISLEFESIAYVKKISLNLDLKENVIIKFNETMLNELIKILLENALKYEKEEGNINIKVDNKLLEINNKNSYIEKEELEHIFQRFYKIEKSRSKEGVGLGLSIANEIVRKNKGSIKCISSKEEGTTFIVLFN